MKTLCKQQMWWTILLAVLAVVLYVYSTAGSVKVAGGCSACPKKDSASTL